MYDAHNKANVPLTECNKRSTQWICVICRCLASKEIWWECWRCIWMQESNLRCTHWGLRKGITMLRARTRVFRWCYSLTNRKMLDVTKFFWFWTVPHTEVESSGAFVSCIPLPRHPRLDSRRRQNTGKMQGYKTFWNLANDFSQDALIGSPENNEKSTKKNSNNY